MVVIRGPGGLELVEYGSVGYVRRSYAPRPPRTGPGRAASRACESKNMYPHRSYPMGIM